MNAAGRQGVLLRGYPEATPAADNIGRSADAAARDRSVGAATAATAVPLIPMVRVVTGSSVPMPATGTATAAGAACREGVLGI